MKVGDKVKLISIPPNTHDTDEMQTLTVFQKSLGRVFPIKEIDIHIVDGVEHRFMRLEVGRVIGRRSSEEVIWVEPECLELVDSK
jgi:hypothetical protein